MSILDYSNAISGIESGGRYGILGPVIPKTGDRAYGKYQVMGANIPVWTEKYLGQRLTPEQFLASPEAQEAVFRGEFGRYIEKYGPEGAARAWFAGEKGMHNPNAKDVLGTTVKGYGEKFMAGLGGAGAASAPSPAPSSAPVGAPMELQPAPTQPAQAQSVPFGLGAPAPQLDMQGILALSQTPPPQFDPLTVPIPPTLYQKKKRQAPRGAFFMG